MSKVKNIYQQYASAEKIAFVDIDFTLTNHPADTDNPKLLNHTLTNKAVELLKQKGLLTVFMTSRTEEMFMSQNTYKISVEQYGFTRPPARPLPEEREPSGILNPLVMATSTGGKIYVKQSDGGYREDIDFRASLPNALVWRQTTMQRLQEMRNHSVFTFSPVESEQNYQNGLTDVFPPDYRIQLLFKTKNDLIDFKKVAQSEKFTLLNESSPDLNKYSLYVCAQNGKVDAANRILHQLQNGDTTEVMIIGDSLPDLFETIGLDLPKATLLLVGGSRLTPYLTIPGNNDFAGEDLSAIKQNMRKIASGMYRFEAENKIREIIICDEKYPGLVGPESIIEYFNEKKYNLS